MDRPKILVSAVGLVEGGPLSILLDLAVNLHAFFDPNDVLYLINEGIAPHFEGMRFETYSWPKTSWLKRLYFEKIHVRSIERRLQPKIWISLHDITANITGAKQLVYCHNPSPFYDRDIPLPVFDLKFALFTSFYERLLRWQIHRNAYVIVQQNWMRDEFIRRFALPKNKIMVARPVPEALSKAQPREQNSVRTACESAPLRLIYPAFPRVLKNIELLGELAIAFEDQPVEFAITIDGTENKYARFLKKKYGGARRLHFLGRQSRTDLLALYRDVDALIFPSRQETWGLPMSEFMETGKPILAADMPYAREVLSGYPMADLFPLDDNRPVVEKIVKLQRGEFRPYHFQTGISEPFCPDWQAFALWVAHLAS